MEDTVENKVKPKRIYHVHYTAGKDGQIHEFQVEADIMCISTDARQHEKAEFKREGKVVAVVKQYITAWWLEEIPSVPL